MTPEPPAAASTLQVTLFGGFDVRINGAPMPPLRSKREQWLLALLVLQGGREVSRPWLAATLWPDNEDEQALFYLRKALSNLRKALGSEAVRIESPVVGTVRLNLVRATVDVVEFDRLMKTDPASAVSLYRGPFLPDCQEEWAILERDQRSIAYASLLEGLAKTSDSGSAIRWLRMLISVDPYRESACRSLMKALSDCGDRAAVTVVYRELHERLFKDLNTSPSPESEALYQELRSRERQVVPSISIASSVDPRRHLPVPLTDLIGREKEIQEVVAWLGERRLVTLVGAGGIGKTRLSIAAAEAVMPLFEQGVWFVDLSPLADPGMVPKAVANVLGITEDPMRPIDETLVDGLVSRQILLVLDNCEHVVEACSDLVERLLTSCSKLSVLATSRQQLHVGGEQIYRVPGLPVPSGEVPNNSSNSLLEYESIRLFVDRSVRVDGDFQITPRNASSVVEICRQLDGIPLAIELAAARLRSMSVKEVGDRLDHRFKLLSSGSRASIPRQQTLRSLIDWSYDLLDEKEKALLMRLSVFAGGWSLEAAEAVCANQLIDQSDVLDLLTSLVDKSLVLADLRHDGSRYGMLETIKQYAAERLAETEEVATWRSRHLDYFLALAEAAEPNLIGAHEKLWQGRLETEHDNLRAAMVTGLEGWTDAEYGLRLCWLLSYFWHGLGHVKEGLAYCGAMLDREGAHDDARARGRALLSAGRLSHSGTDLEVSKLFIDEAVPLLKKQGDDLGVAQALNGLGLISSDKGDYSAARAMHLEALAIRRKLGDPWTLSQSLVNLGGVESAEENFDLARTYFEESLAIRRQVGMLRGTAIVLDSLGESIHAQGDFVASKKCWLEALELFRQAGDLARVGAQLTFLGKLATEVGDFDEAKIWLREALAISRVFPRKETIARLLDASANTAIGNSDHLTASRLWGASEATREAFGGRLWPIERERLSLRVAASRSAFGDEPSFEAAWNEGRAMGLERVLDLAATTI